MRVGSSAVGALPTAAPAVCLSAMTLASRQWCVRLNGVDDGSLHPHGDLHKSLPAAAGPIAWPGDARNSRPATDQQGHGAGGSTAGRLGGDAGRADNRRHSRCRRWGAGLLSAREVLRRHARDHGVRLQRHARRRGGAGARHHRPVGAFLDSTLDRIGDGAVFGALALWYAGDGDNTTLCAVAIYDLVLGAVTSYAKARAESLGMTANVGIAERSERLIAILVLTGLSGLFDLPVLRSIGLWGLAVATTITVAQRIREVHRQTRRDVAV